jgi:ferredoxin
MAVRFRVDWIRCDGYGLCGDLVPDLIDLDEWRYPDPRPEPIEASRIDDAQRAVDCCPMKALVLEPISVDDRPEPAAWRRTEGRTSHV